MESSQFKLKRPRMIANFFIYASIVVGIVLLWQFNSVVPPWLFFSVLFGWIAYLITGVAAYLQIRAAYPVSLCLAGLTLAVSLPQPEHYSFGTSIPSATFIVGSVLQIGVILSVARYILLERHR